MSFGEGSRCEWRASRRQCGVVEQSMFSAMKDDLNVTEADVRAILAEHGLELPLSIKDLMRHWNW
jgi:hypothetical protein